MSSNDNVMTSEARQKSTQEGGDVSLGLNQQVEGRDLETIYEQRGVTEEGKALLDVTFESLKQEDVSPRTQIELEVVKGLIKGARTISPLLSIQQETGQAILAQVLPEKEFRKPVQVRLASDVIFEVDEDPDGGMRYVLRSLPKTSQLLQHYLEDTGAR